MNYIGMKMKGTQIREEIERVYVGIEYFKVGKRNG